MDCNVRRSNQLPELTPIEFNILVSLSTEDRHGLGLIQEIAERTENELFLSPGTLYTALKRMSKVGWIAHSDVDSNNTVAEERRKYYQITDVGRRLLVQEVERMERVAQLTRSFLGLSPPEGSSETKSQGFTCAEVSGAEGQQLRLICAHR